MKKKTLAELEETAEHQWEEKARWFVQAIAERENVEFDELYVHLVEYGVGRDWVHASFKFPGHSLIQMHGGLGQYPPLEFTEKGLEGEYIWMAWTNSKISTPHYTGYSGLGEALLAARWSYKQDERAVRI